MAFEITWVCARLLCIFLIFIHDFRLSPMWRMYNDFSHQKKTSLYPSPFPFASIFRTRVCLHLRAHLCEDLVKVRLGFRACATV